jgi:hypothetical protein
MAARLASIAPVAALLLAVAWSSWNDYRIDPPPTREAKVVALLREKLPEAKQGGGAALVLGGAAQAEVEQISVGVYRLELAGAYRFVDLAEQASRPSVPGDTRPALYVGDLLDRLRDAPASVPGLCSNVYYVDPAFADRFRAIIAAGSLPCGRSPRYYLLPSQ